MTDEQRPDLTRMKEVAETLPYRGQQEPAPELPPLGMNEQAILNRIKKGGPEDKILRDIAEGSVNNEQDRNEAIIRLIEHISDVVVKGQQKFIDASDNTSLAEIMKNKCSDMSSFIREYANDNLGMRATSFINNASYVGGEKAPHAVSLIDIGNKQALLIDGSYPQHVLSDQQRALFIKGSLSEIRRALQETFGGGWDMLNDDIFEGETPYDITSLSIPTRSSDIAVPVTVIDASGLTPRSPEEVESDLRYRTLIALSKHKKFDDRTMIAMKKDGYVARTSSGGYEITDTGKTFMNQINQNLQQERIPSTSNDE